MKLNTKAFAMTCGIFWALTMALMTVWMVIRNDPCSFMDNFSAIYFGYTVSWSGVVIGAIWGFVDGLIGGAVFAWLYNKLCGS
jgi:hypothetical protein